MKFFSEEFEYLVQNMRHPSIKEMEKYDYDAEEYKTMKWWNYYFELMLTELGAKGWELIIKYDNSSEKSATGIAHTNDELIFKRSSKSKYYNTGIGVDRERVSALAKQQAKDNHIT